MHQLRASGTVAVTAPAAVPAAVPEAASPAVPPALEKAVPAAVPVALAKAVLEAVLMGVPVALAVLLLFGQEYRSDLVTVGLPLRRAWFFGRKPYVYPHMVVGLLVLKRMDRCMTSIGLHSS